MSREGYKYFLTCCSLMKNEGKYLREWLDHYISEGVEHFYIIDNGSTDDTVEILKSYNNITLFHDNRRYPHHQVAMYNDHLLPIIKESKWTMIVDADELMKGQNNKTIYTYLQTIARPIHSIYVIWKMFIGKGDDVEKMSDMTTRFNYDYLFDTNIKLDYCNCKDLQYFMLFGKTIFKTQNIDRLRVHKQLVPGVMIDNFRVKLDMFPDTISTTCKYMNETTLRTADVVLNHYFIKTNKEYRHRVKKISEVGEWNCPGWPYLGWLKSLYNLDDKYMLTED